ncbi:MAG: chemotaxis protein CheD [Deltaproteobacteria bacterium]|nr:chemotaxis protein CheD [Deltaproteobacteria bacterium]
MGPGVVRHLVRGNLWVGAGEAVIHAVVGAGYGVAVKGAPGRLSGMVHLDGRWSGPGVAAEGGGDSVPELLRSFFDALGGVDALRGARAEIAGGADVLRLLPRQAHEEAVARAVTLLSEALWARTVGVDRVTTGGAATRRMSLWLPDGVVSVEQVGVAARAQADAVDPGGLDPGGAHVRTTTVNMGCICVDVAPHLLLTLLGSCVGVALYDDAVRIGGLAHVMLPESRGRAAAHGRYADTAIPALIEALVAAGAARERLRAKIAGGASVLFGAEVSRFQRISEANVAVVREALAAAGIPIVAEEVGGSVGRRMLIYLASFGVKVTPFCSGVCG